MQERYLQTSIAEDIPEKMVFLGGPRQVGKTTFARDMLGAGYKSAYYNWDKITQRREALRGRWPSEVALIILDEFHKHRKWKSWIKGEYDTRENRYTFLLTGSARLDIYPRGGDSLQGRYHHYRMHPFSLAELTDHRPAIEPPGELQFENRVDPVAWDNLLRYGGFPEPFLKQSEKHARRWRHERLDRFFREDIRDLTQIQDLGNLLLLADLLPERVSSVLSINSLAEDLQVNHRTVARWLDVFEYLYYCFRLAPYRARTIASVRKEKKLYLWDWSVNDNAGALVENIIASHLLKFCHYLEDTEGRKISLHYLRDNTGREVDFLVTHQNRPWFALEAKAGDRGLSTPLLYFKDRLKIPYCYQLGMDTTTDRIEKGVRIMPAAKFLSALV
jgi:uncharacterized protein